MPSNIFKRVDVRYFSSAFAEMTHSRIDNYALGLEISPIGNKIDKANQTIQYIFELPETDALLIELLNYLYVENATADWLLSGESFKSLKSNVLDPRGLTLGENGFVLPDGRDIDQLDTHVSPPTSPQDRGAQTNAPKIGDLTNFINDLGTSKPKVVDSRKVFVVHGRDYRPVEALEEFLRFLGLQLMSWSEAVLLTGRPQPHTFEIVKAGMARAAAIIVIFSPDELAKLKQEFFGSKDEELELRGQARPNVLLEAGMAYAHSPEKTIFLKSGDTRDISDIAGFNWVKLDGKWDSRNDLKNRLIVAGAAIHDGDLDLGDPRAGAFSVVNY